MKNIFILSCALLLFSCSNKGNDTAALQQRRDSVEQQPAKIYKPGLGEFMSSIQVHHAKLWFAGTNQNWQLAEFEMGEIGEALDNITLYCADRPEIKTLRVINPALDSLRHALASKNLQSFKKGFVLLTADCNSCHRATNHAFNVIIIPRTPPFTNQDFAAHTQ
ncbi:MAG: hypothetical protein ABI813_09700 [Bacteroidota bacterium]